MTDTPGIGHSPFEAHEIRHLSWSSLRTFRNEPALWVLRYLHGYRDMAGPGAWRGKAVEAGLDWFLYKGQEGAVDAALKQFDMDYHEWLKRREGEIPDNLEEEADVIEPMVLQAIEAAKEWGTPVARQYRIEHWVDGVEVPIVGYVDYVFESRLVDLKTTKALPGKPRPEDVRQVAIYSAASGKPAALAYVTGKKHAVYDIEQDHEALRDVARLARSVRTLLTMADRAQAMRLFAPNFDNFYWDSEARKEWERIAA